MEGSGEESEEEEVRASLAAAGYRGREGVGGGRAQGVEMAGGTSGARPRPPTVVHQDRTNYDRL
jgi:hypothetical protein